MRTLFSIFAVMFSSIIFAQEKVEIEDRINAEEVPKEAILWFRDAYEDATRVRWYIEKNQDSKSYEAKLKWKGQKHSVEFSETGTIEDIEVLISWERLSTSTREALQEYFSSHYEKYRIRKIQRQWIGESDDLEDAIEEGEFEEVETRYEIEFYGRTSSQKELWEGLFDIDGHLIQRRIIKLRPTQNLIY